MARYFIFFVMLFFTTQSVFSQKTSDSVMIAREQKDSILAELSCGICQFGMPGNSCKLAARIGGSTYYLSGYNIDDFGDAHATDGFCNTIRKAYIRVKFDPENFKLTYVRLLPYIPEEKSGTGK